MAVVASGVLSEPIDDLRSLIATLASWQTWTGHATAATAIEHIYLVEATAAAGVPFVILDYGDDISMVRQSVRADMPWKTDGWIAMYIRAAVATATPALTDAEVMLTFYNNVGALLGDLQLAGWQPPKLCIESMVVRGMARTDEAKRTREGDYNEAVVGIQLRCLS
jgi:hypothetical protein